MRDRLKMLAVKGAERAEALRIITELLQKEMDEFRKDPKRAMEHAREFASNGRLTDARLKGIGTPADAAHLIEHAMIRTARDIAGLGVPESRLQKISVEVYECLQRHKDGHHLDDIPSKFI